nr:hypothetical protein [Tanacetum cinerariifolium]
MRRRCEAATWWNGDVDGGGGPEYSSTDSHSGGGLEGGVVDVETVVVVLVLVLLQRLCDGARPSPRLTQDAFEAQAEWWVSSRAFFKEQDRLLKEARAKVEAHDLMINQMHAFLQGMQVGTMPRPMKGPVDVHKHYGLSDFSVFQNTQDYEVMITGARATKDYVSFENVDPNKGFRAMESFWREQVPQMYKGCHYKVNDPIKVGWLLDDVYMPINAGGLTAVEALESIQETVNHSHRWHKEESDKKTSNNYLSTITDKLKNLYNDTKNVRENIHKINLKSNMEFRHKEELVSNKIQIEELSMVKLNARCFAVLQNELPLKEKDPRSFVLPCIIRNTTISNALADLGAIISVISFSMFKRLGLGNSRSINMVTEMADRSMQSLKGIVENVLVKIRKFIFPLDFVILDIVEDNKLLIILGTPMLATAHARIDVFGGKISLEVGK